MSGDEDLVRTSSPMTSTLGATAGRQRPVESAPTTYLRSKDRHRNREATMYLPASRRRGPRVDSTVSICKFSIASSMTRSRRCLQASLAVGTEYPLFSVMGVKTLPAYREHLPYRVTSTEQGKPAALPARGSDVARPIDGDAGMRSGRKRMLFCNGADTGCVSSTDNITGRESGQTSLWCFTRENLTNRLTRQGR